MTVITTRAEPRRRLRARRPPARGLGEKARRYLGEGRVLIVRRTEGRVEATIRGERGTYRVVDGRCDCPARVSECAHVIAVALVTDPDGGALACQHDGPRQTAADLLSGAEFRFAASQRRWRVRGVAPAGDLLRVHVEGGRTFDVHPNAPVVIL